MKIYRLLPAATVLLGGLLCACSQQARRDRFVHRGDRYFADGNYDSAELEYLNAGRIDPHDARAISQLGVIYFAEGRLAKAREFLLGGQQLDPDNLEVRMDLGLFDLAAGKNADAASEARFVLGRDPAHPAAPLLLAESVERSSQIGPIRSSIERLPHGAPALVALATLDLKEDRVKHAIAELQEALRLDPKCANAYTALATIYWAEKDPAKAGPNFSQAAALAPVRSGKRLQYVQFKIRTGDEPGARAILADVLAKAPDYLPARMLLAELEESEKNYAEAQAAVNNIISRDPAYPDALLLSGRLALATNQPARAVTTLEYAQTFYSRYPLLKFELAQAYLGTGASEKAESALTLALALAPDFSDAAMSLAEIDDHKGDYPSEIVLLKQTVQRHPDLAKAWLLLANAYVHIDQYDDALAIYRNLAAANPHASRPLVLEGIALEHNGQLDDAEGCFKQALAVAPSDPVALQQLIELYVDEHKYDVARHQLQDRLAKDGATAAVYTLLGRVDLAEHNFPGGEAELKKAISLEPNSADAYFLLAELYYTTKQDRQALADLQKVVTADPSRTQALMLMGSIQMVEKDYPAARDTYEKTIAVDPNFSPALNNLAYLYSEQFNDIDRGFEMAQRARKLLPDEPHAEDTLGWVLYRKREFAWALSLLQDAAANLPGDAEAEYHLAMSQYMMGQEDGARQSLRKAVGESADFTGREDALKRLAILSINVATAGAAERSLLEGERSDPIALGRLAAIYERDGKFDEALSTCQAALAIDPHDISALTRQARLYEAKGNLEKAYDVAKSAHDYAPGDVDASLVLGRLAYRQGNYSWAESVLSDAANLRPDDAELRYELALAEYSLGRVDQASLDMRRASQGAAGNQHAADEDRFLRLVSAGAGSGPPPPDDLALARTVLTADPNDAPALMVEARALSASGDMKGAIQRWQQVVDRFKEFAPAERQLALAYVANPGDQRRMQQAALAAREAYPDDPAVAKACGIIAFRQGEFDRAEQLLNDSAAAADQDGETYYYLGMAQLNLKQHSAPDTLKRSLQLNLPPALAADARKALAQVKQ